jgi:hypothetical protein
MRKLLIVWVVTVFSYGFEYGVEYKDPYYMNINTTFSLSDEPVETVVEKNEFLLYQHLLIDSLLPKFLYLEASLNALPTAGALWKEWHRTSYDFMTVFDINLVETVFTGFEEPYAVSMFLGKVVKFGVEGETVDDANKGFAGYLFSYGNYHIKDMEFIEDHWLEFEWKVKGKKVVETQKLDWSFRIGTKFHSNEYIANTLYFGIRRNNVDIEETIPFLSNSAFNYKINMRLDTFEVTRNYLTLDKKYLFWGRKAVSLVVGFVHETQSKYMGPLTRQIENDFKLIIRPNLSF